MSKANTFENQLLEHILNNVDIPNVGDAAGLQNSAANGSLYLSLHTSDPVEADAQTTNEIAYTGYARVAVARDGTQWTVASGTATLQANKDFAEMTAGAGGTVTHWGIGTSSSGAGQLLYSGTTDPDIVVAIGVIPRVKLGTTISED